MYSDSGDVFSSYYLIEHTNLCEVRNSEASQVIMQMLKTEESDFHSNMMSFLGFCKYSRYSDEMARLDHFALLKKKDGVVCGFCLASMESIDIFYVSKELRGLGLGSWFASCVLNHLAKSTQNLEIICFPKETFNFWRRFGFRHHKEDHEHIYATLNLNNKP
tara:strand:+ start:632 stop:1117 length:486 start_codon:yes stop_codon:yes gene_type:complete